MLPSRDEALWDCACECALRRVHHDCKHKFDSDACNRCNFYIKQYGDFSPTDARLYMMEAMKFAYMDRSDRRVWWGIGLMFAAAIALIVYAGIWEDRRLAKVHAEMGLSSPRAVAVTTKDKAQAAISSTLTYTQQQLNNKVDVNHDGLVNCIDAAVIFYGKYPYKQDVTIESNFHPDGRMSHLFNVVRINGVWRAVEPQAYWKGHASYWMKDIWGDAYDNRYNADETEVYRRYVK